MEGPSILWKSIKGTRPIKYNDNILPDVLMPIQKYE
jgi:hypothetical protein